MTTSSALPPAPSTTTKCPRCFNVLSSEWHAWVEAHPAELFVDERASAYTGRPVSLGKVFEAKRPADAVGVWTPDISWAQQNLGGPVKDLCPICHFVLPPDWRWGATTCVAMAGALATGKTVFTAVMIKRLQWFAEKLTRVVDPVTVETDRVFTETYERPLFEERGILQPTPSAKLEGSYQHEPLIFSLGQWGGTRRYLVIRDVAGEDLENVDALANPNQWQFFQNADAVLFLFDPLRVDEIRHQLQDLVPMSDNVGGDPKKVLRNVMDLLRGRDTKFAVVLSKFDVLQELARVRGSNWGRIMSNQGAAFSRDPGLAVTDYDERDGELLNAEVHSLLGWLGADPILQKMENPLTGQQYRHRFFAVSALGRSPVGERLHRNGISPFRCLDPIRWILSDVDVLQPSLAENDRP